MKKSIRIDTVWALMVTIPLGYYVSWMQWLAWVNVVVVITCMFFITLVLAFNPNLYFKHDISPALLSKKHIYSVLKSLVMVIVMFLFGWKISASIIIVLSVFFQALKWLLTRP